MNKTHGLTLGKFAPLHKGHQLVIDTALDEMDEVSVVIYDAPDVTSIPLNVRSNWIKTLYPKIKVIEAWDGPTEMGNTFEIKKKQEKYLLESLKISGITHFYSSEFYGEHVSIAFGAKNRLVDSPREIVPVSASKIRDNPFLYRKQISPIVYQDLITNVVFLGAPSTGKTTIARKLAKEYKTVWMPEYGREYWEKNQVNRKLSLSQLVEIAEEHLVQENKLLYESNEYLFTDTNAITTFLFSLSYHQAVDWRLAELAKLAENRYDLVFLCDTDIPYDDTWDRSGEVKRNIFQKQIIGDLLVRKIPFFILRGDTDARITTVKEILGKFKKYELFTKSFMKKV